MREQCKLDVMDALVYVTPRAAARRADEVYINHAVFAAEAVFAVVHERQAYSPQLRSTNFWPDTSYCAFFNAVVFSRFSLDMTEGDV